MSAYLLGQLQATDRNGMPAGRLDIVRWPVTIGRALTADLVIDDSHLAAEHLRLDRNAEGEVVVTVLETVNGVALESARHASGAQFAWPMGQSLNLGRLKLGLRLAGEPLAAEEPLPRRRLRTVGWTLLALACMLAVTLCQSWLMFVEPSQFGRQLPGVLGIVVLGIILWAGLWALVTRLFAGHAQFWRHVRIACFSSVALQLVLVATGLLAFMFSLESLDRFSTQLMMVGLAVNVYFHLAVIAPLRRRVLAAGVACLTVLVITAMLGTSWLQNGRLSNRLYLTSLYPPSWRMAPAVSLKQFMDDAGSMRKRLDARLKDRDPGDGAEGDTSDSE